MKWLPLLILLLAWAGLVVFVPDNWLTLENLQSSKVSLQEIYDELPAVSLLVYMAGYTIITALSLPVATLLSLAGGAVFGVVAGTLAVSFASTAGATLAFLMARYYLRDWVTCRYPEAIQKMNDGFARGGKVYLLVLRLAPIFPFFLINLVMGLTTMKALTFFWVSQVGMLAGTIIYVNAGCQLSDIQSMDDILSTNRVVSLALVALFLLVSHQFIKKQKTQNRAD